jgi:hypothetical protein
MRLLAKPSFVRQPKPPHRRRIRDQRAGGQLVIPAGEPTPDQSGNRPESDQRDQQQNDVAISPTKPPIRTDPVACRAAVGSIIDVGVTGRTFHGWSPRNCRGVVPQKQLKTPPPVFAQICCKTTGVLGWKGIGIDIRL